MSRKPTIKAIASEIVDTPEAARMLGITRGGILWLTRTGQLPSIRLTTVRLFLRRDVEALARKRASA